jgi:hypothetical protein
MDMAKLESISALLGALAAMTGSVVGVLTYLDSSERLENPVGSAVRDAFSDGAGGGGGDDDGNGDSDTTSTTGGPPEVDVLWVTVDTFGCDITVAWDATGEGTLELLRDGVSIADSLPVGPDSRPDNALNFGEGNYEVTYEVVGKDSAGREDKEFANGADVCIG